MKASADNVFIGAKVTKDKKEFTVIKVNSKSFYLAPDTSLESYQTMWDMRPKKQTFKEFCEKHKFPMEKYEGFEIAEDEAAKKAVIENSQKGVNLYKLDKAIKLIIADFLKYNKLRLLCNLQAGSKIFRILEMKDKDKFLLNVEDEYILYNSSIDTAVKIGDVYSVKKEDIDWEKITPKL